MLIENDEYRSYLRAVHDSQAVEGSLAADNLMAAQMIRAKAKTIDGNEVGKENLATINKALNVVLRRYHVSRKERRNLVGGEQVPGENGVE